MQELLNKYVSKFRKLRVDRSHNGAAPHKPILLISILQAYRHGLINDDRIYITPELVALFKGNWTTLVTSEHHCQFVYPFFYMKSEKFWQLKPKPGYDTFLKNASVIKSFNKLNDAVDYAIIDRELVSLMKNPTDNNILQTVLLDVYFPTTKDGIHDQIDKTVWTDLENKILNDDAEVYQEEVRKLILEREEEEIFLRGGTFKKEIPKIYDYTCCISRLKIDATINVSMVDACHIIPFSESYNDTITNGLALCPNLHRAFDRGMITIDDNYRVVVSDNFIESTSDYGIKKFRGEKILLPNQAKYYPNQENLEWHRENRFR